MSDTKKYICIKKWYNFHGDEIENSFEVGKVYLVKEHWTETHSNIHPSTTDMDGYLIYSHSLELEQKEDGVPYYMDKHKLHNYFISIRDKNLNLLLDV